MRNSTINRLFALAALLVPACAVFETRWYRVAPPMEPVWVQVPVEQLRAVCWERETALRNRACVVRNLERRECYVFAAAPESEFSDDDLHHEKQKHCREGLNHD